MNDELVKYGKEMISEAITDQGIETSATAMFDAMADNIRALKVGGGGNALLVLSAFPNYTINYKSTEADIDETITLEDTEYQRIVPVTKGYIYTVVFTGGGSTLTKQVSVADSDKYYCAASIDFSYTGNSNVRDDGVIELLSSGSITFNAAYNLDIFLVGGGGGAAASSSGGASASGGGGGGYTKTQKNVEVVIGSLPVTIGAGGTGGKYQSSSPTNGSSTSFDTYSVSGGLASALRTGGNGGSGGAAPAYTEEYSPGKRGVDGGNGTKGSSSGSSGTYGTPGTGQGTTTREFGESDGKLYADGGAGGGSYVQGTGEGGGGAGAKSGAGGNGVANTGGGGGGSSKYSNGGSGGSGIVCIRLHKEEYLLSGTWVFRDNINYIAIDQDINFTSNSASYTHFSNRYTTDNLHNLMYYGTAATPETIGVFYYDTTNWVNSAYKTITFTGENSVSHAFYTWFINNAIKSE